MNKGVSVHIQQIADLIYVWRYDTVLIVINQKLNMLLKSIPLLQAWKVTNLVKARFSDTSYVIRCIPHIISASIWYGWGSVRICMMIIRQLLQIVVHRKCTTTTTPVTASKLTVNLCFDWLDHFYDVLLEYKYTSTMNI